MKTLLICATVCVLSLAGFAQQTPGYPDSEAAKHVGEEAAITGKVATVFASGKGTTFINFGARFPRHTFTAVVFARNEAAVGDVKQFEGKDVTVTGRIELSPTDQKPQIVLSRADQIKLAGTAPAPAAAPSAPPPPPAPVTPPPPPVTVTPAAPPAGSPPPAVMAKSGVAGTPEPPYRKTEGRMMLSPGWNGPSQGGEMTRKDLARLFGESGEASQDPSADTLIDVYPGVPFLTPVAQAAKTLNLQGVAVVRTKISTPGLPKGSLTANTYAGVFPGGFNRLTLVTDMADQVVSVLAVDTSARTRVPNETDTIGYHTYNFITGGAKAKNDLMVRHQIAADKPMLDVVVVDTLLVDPTDPESPPPIKMTKGSSSRSTTQTKPKTGKVMERARWYVPQALVDLILHCVVR